MSFDYCGTVALVDEIGKTVGDFLVWIDAKLALNGSERYIYGHSLGSHISGGAARQFRFLTGRNISLIVGKSSLSKPASVLTKPS